MADSVRSIGWEKVLLSSDLSASTLPIFIYYTK